MTTPVLDQNRAYRKGLILGFTMAEISILIIFCLLLATSLIIQNTIQKNKVIISKLSQENKRLVLVKDTFDEWKKNSTSKMEFDDLFQELARVKTQTEKMKAIQAELDKRSTEVKELEVIKKSLPTNTSNKSIKEIVSELVSDAQYTKEIKESLKSTSLKASSAKEIAKIVNSSGKLSEVVAEKMKALNEVERLKKILNEHLGKGADWPSCWDNPITKKHQYIFTIDLTSSGLIIHDEHVQNRINDQKLLPLNTIHFDQNLSQNDFLAQTNPLFQWSKQNNCRFFVIARDRTSADQKNTYKRLKQSLEARFYKFEQ